jgi:hypothetical protein
MIDFDEQLKKEVDNIIEAQKEITKRVAISAFGDAIRRSPVGNVSLWKSGYKPVGYVGGRFRSNWFLGVGTPSRNNTDSIVSQEQKTKVITDGIIRDKVEFDYILSNNLPYAERLEAGHSTQAPNGVVAPTIIRAQKNFTKITKLVYKRRGIEG